MTWVTCARPIVAQIPDVPGWQLFFHDEFDGTSLNTTNWEALDRQNSFNNEKQYYRPEQVTVANGNLQITATNQPLANKLYRSGLITSKALYGPGRFEARIDLPTTQGMWPAFWLNAEPGSLAAGRRNRHPGKQGQPADDYEQCAFIGKKIPGHAAHNWHYVSHNYSATAAAIRSISTPGSTHTRPNGIKIHDQRE